MPRVAKKNITAKYHHVMVQGINKENIFENVFEIKKYKNLLQVYKLKYDIEIISYCFMTNHVHLILYSKNVDKISRYMHQINTKFAITYNKRRERVGYVYRNRYRSEGIYDNLYLKQCIVYIHNNPVKAGMCVKPNEYGYSSYNEYLTGKAYLISLNVFNDLFENLQNFKNSHKKVKIDNYLDISDEKEKFINNEVNEFLTNNCINKDNIFSKRNILKPFVRCIIDKKMLAKKDLAKKLKISVYLFNKIYYDER